MIRSWDAALWEPIDCHNSHSVLRSRRVEVSVRARCNPLNISNLRLRLSRTLPFGVPLALSRWQVQVDNGIDLRKFFQALEVVVIDLSPKHEHHRSQDVLLRQAQV
jgi:hypothetical protein